MTKYYVDNKNGIDTNDGKSEIAPFKTLGKALAVITNGDIIELATSTEEYVIENATKFNQTEFTLVSKDENDRAIVNANLLTVSFAKGKSFENIYFKRVGYWNSTDYILLNYKNCIFEGNGANSAFWTNADKVNMDNVLITNFHRSILGNYSINLVKSSYDSSFYNVAILNCLGVNAYANEDARIELINSVVGSDVAVDALTVSGDYKISENNKELIVENGVKFGFIRTANISKTLILHQNEYKKYQEEILPSSNELIPLITSNTNSYVTFEGTTPSNGGEWWRMFDGNPADFWYIQALSGEITFTFAENKKVTKYFISHSNNPLNANRLPRTWTFEGSTDGVNYIVIDTRTVTDWASLGYESYFSIDSPNYYKSYKLNITTNSGNGAFTSIQSMSLQQEEGVYTPAQWLTISNSLPTQEQFLIDGMDSLSPLLDRRVEALEPLPMTEDSTQMENGKLFSKTIDLKKYMDIRSINVEVE